MSQSIEDQVADLKGDVKNLAAATEANATAIADLKKSVGGATAGPAGPIDFGRANRPSPDDTLTHVVTRQTDLAGVIADALYGGHPNGDGGRGNSPEDVLKIHDFFEQKVDAKWLVARNISPYGGVGSEPELLKLLALSNKTSWARLAGIGPEALLNVDRAYALDGYTNADGWFGNNIAQHGKPSGPKGASA